MELSIVIPAKNEAQNARSLITEIREALHTSLDYEVLYVDDGSTDETPRTLYALRREGFRRLRILRHAACCGQSAAIRTGVVSARAAWIATLDGDGQNDPADIPRLWSRRSQTGDRVALIAGQRVSRRDGWSKRVSSMVANKVRMSVLHDQTPDTGCGLKLFERQAFLELPWFDHMHRFLPALIQRAGRTVDIVEVRHRPRLHGRTKYGIRNRLWAGVIDLLGVAWLQWRMQRPCVYENEEGS